MESELQAARNLALRHEDQRVTVARAVPSCLTQLMMGIATKAQCGSAQATNPFLESCAPQGRPTSGQVLLCSDVICRRGSELADSRYP